MSKDNTFYFTIGLLFLSSGVGSYFSSEVIGCAIFGAGLACAALINALLKNSKKRKK